MNDKDFNRLVKAVKQFVQVKHGDMKSSRLFKFTTLDVKALREACKENVN